MAELKAIIIDDDEFILRALQRMLKRLVPHWHITYLQHPTDVLEQLTHADDFLLVISDRMMPEMLGEDLLAKVRQQAPTVIRALLTADTSAEVVIQDCCYIHHFLAKPFVEADLLRVFHSVEQLQSLPLDSMTRCLLGHLNELPLLPSHFFQLQHLCHAPETTSEQIAQLVAKDPVLAGRVLQLANSSFMGYSRSTLILDEAIMRLGFDLLLSIAVVLYSQGQFSEKLSETEHARLLQPFWQRAACARLIARHGGLMGSLQDKAFMLSLLRALGALVLAANPLPASPNNTPNFADVITAYLLTLWGFDPMLRDVLLRQSESQQVLDEIGLLQFCLWYSEQLVQVAVNPALPAPNLTQFPQQFTHAMQTLWQQVRNHEIELLGVV